MKNIEEQEISQENTLHHKEMEISYLKEKNKELQNEVINKDKIIENMAKCIKRIHPAFDDLEVIINHFSLKNKN